MPISRDRFTWITSEGGPLLLLSESNLNDWEGIAQPPSGRSVTASFRLDPSQPQATDYDRACDVKGYLGVLAVGAGLGLVLNNEPDPTAWFSNETQTGGTLIRMIYAEGEEDAEGAIASLTDLAWDECDHLFVTNGSGVYLFDAAYVGREIRASNDVLKIALPAGSYRIRTAEYRPDKFACLVLHRLDRIELQ